MTLVRPPGGEEQTTTGSWPAFQRLKASGNHRAPCRASPVFTHEPQAALDKTKLQSIITTSNFRAIENHLRSLRTHFAPFGSIEFHGCKVGAGAEGQRLLRMTAQATGVPVTAGIRSQYFGPNSAYRFEGPTRTVFPGSQTLREWAQAQEAAAAQLLPR